MRPLKTVQAWIYKRRLAGWTDVNDLYLRGRTSSWVKLSFLTKVAELAKECRGPILECGSGLTTEVIRRHAPKCTLVSLEQHIGWAMKTGAWHAPIDWDTGWYRALPQSDFCLVVVDGPDGGNRAGFIDSVGLSSGCKVIIDDTNNHWEGRRVVEALEKAYPCESVQRHGNKEYNFTVITVR